MKTKEKHFLQAILKRPFGTLAIIAFLSVLGSVSFLNIPINLMPDIVYPMIRVQVDAGEMPPDIVANSITRILEQSLSEAEGIELIESSSTQGQSQITLSFLNGTDIDISLMNVAGLVDRVKEKLPPDISAPVIFKFDPQNLPVLEMVLTSEQMDITALRRFAEEDFVYRFVNTSGVAGVRPAGGRKREIQVMANPDKLRAHGLSFANLTTALETENQQKATGRLDFAGKEHTGQVQSVFQKIEDLKELRLATPNADLVRLAEVALVQDRYAEQRIIVRVNGKEGVKLSFFKNPQMNSVDVARNIRERLQELRQKGQLPAGLTLAVTSDESLYIVSSIANAQHALLLAIVLVALVVLVFLKDWRFTLICMAVLPVSLLVTLLLMKTFNLSLNLMSIGGLIVGVGLLVDYGIVFIENITRHYLESQELETSIQSAFKEVATPLVASLLALVAVIGPFLLAEGITLLFFREFILVVIFSTVSGLLIALVLVPVLYSFIDTQNNPAHDHVAYPRYTQALSFCLRHRWGTVGTGAAALVAAYLLSQQLGSIFLPEIDDGRVTVQMRGEPGLLLETMRNQAQRVEQLLVNQPEASVVDVTIGGKIGQTIQETPAESEILVQLVPKQERNLNVQEWIAALADKANALNLPGMKVSVKKARIRAIRTFKGQASSGDHDVVVNVKGQDPLVLADLGNQVRDKLRGIAGLVDVKTELAIKQPLIQFVVNNRQATGYGVSSQEIARNVYTAINGTVASRYQETGNFYNIRVMLEKQSLHDQAKVLPLLPLQRLENGDMLLLGQVADLREIRGPLAIDRVNQTTVNMVNATVRGRTLGEVAGSINAALSEINLPQGYELSYGGRLATLEQGDSNQLLWAGLIGLILLFVILTVLYESLITPLIMLLVLPVGLLGAVAALYFTGLPLSATALIGFVLLFGIATNNAIVMVAFFEQLRREGATVRQAVLEGTALRLQPKLMTALIAMAGMVPLALGTQEGGEILQPLAIALLGGMPISLVATLFVLPVLYAAVHERQKTETIAK